MVARWMAVSLLTALLSVVIGLPGCTPEVRSPEPERPTQPLTVPWPVEAEN